MRWLKPLGRGLDWGLYDFANSGYYLVYSVLVLPLYLSSVALKDDPWLVAKWGMAQGCSVALALLFGLLFARWLDRRGLRAVGQIAMVVPALASLLVPCLVYLKVGGHGVLLGYVFVNGLYLFSLTVYDASLAHVARGEESVTVSGWAWGWGYMGGLLCLGIMEVGLRFHARYSWAHFATGSFFFIIFAFLAALRLPAQLAFNGKIQWSASTVERLGPRPYDLKLRRWVLLLMLVFAVDGIAVFLTFFSIYANKVVLLPERDITKMMGLLQLLAFPLTGFLCGQVHRGIARLLWFCGCVWALAVFLVLAIPTVPALWASIVCVSAVVGTTQALLRAIYANTVSPATAISGFSVYAVAEKGAAFVGPLLAGILVVATGYHFVFGLAGLSILCSCALLATCFSRSKGSG